MGCMVSHLVASSLCPYVLRVMVMFAPESPLKAEDVDVLDIYGDPDEDR